MNEKRFIVADHSSCVFDKITKEEYVCIDREEAFLVCKKLNELNDKNEQLKEVLQKTNPYYNCTLKTKNDLLHLQYIFEICNILIDDAVTEEDYDLAVESISQFYSRMQHFNQDKNSEKRINYIRV